MKLTVKTAALIKVLEEAISAVPSASTEPMYRNFLISVDDGRLEVLASDGTVTIKTWLDDSNIVDTETGAIQVPAHFLLDAVRKLEGNEVVIQTADTGLVTISDGKTVYKLNTQDAAEYPDIYIDFDDSGAISVSMADFIKLFNSTSFACASKSAKQCFTGINIRTQGGRLLFLATDACRLAQMSVPLDSERELRFTVATKVLATICRKEGVDTVSFEQSESKALFKAGNAVYQSRLYSGDFPQIDKIRPTNTPYLLTVNSSEFLAALDRMTIVTQGTPSSIAHLTCSSDKCELLAYSPTVGDAKETLHDFTFEGDIFRIAFNTRFVSDAIKALNSPKVTLAFAGESKIFAARSEDPYNDQIITPIRTNS